MELERKMIVSKKVSRREKRTVGIRPAKGVGFGRTSGKRLPKSQTTKAVRQTTRVVVNGQKKRKVALTGKVNITWICPLIDEGEKIVLLVFTKEKVGITVSILIGEEKSNKTNTFNIEDLDPDKVTGNHPHFHLIANELGFTPLGLLAIIKKNNH